MTPPREHIFETLARDLRRTGAANWQVGDPADRMQVNLLLSPGQRATEKHLRASVVTGQYHTATYTLTSAVIVPPTATIQDIASMIQRVVEELFHSIATHMDDAERFRLTISPMVPQ